MENQEKGSFLSELRARTLADACAEYKDELGGSTIREFAERWKISPRTVYNEAKENKIIITKIRGRAIITRTHEAAWAAQLPTMTPQAAA